MSEADRIYADYRADVDKINTQTRKAVIGYALAVWVVALAIWSGVIIWIVTH